MRNYRKIVVLLSAVLIVIILSLTVIWVKFGQRAQKYECTNFAMNTYVQQTVYGSKRVEAATAAAKSVGALEDLISCTIDGSDIAKLNAASGSDWVQLDPKTIAILETGLDVAKKSDGAFEPTILPISSLWNFGGENQHVPSDDDIKKYIKFVNYNDLRIDKQNNSASLKFHYMAVDLGAIAEGAACDEAVAAYRDAGADCGIVAVGNSTGVYGTKADKTAWNIAVRDSGTGAQADTVGTVDLTSGFISTSGIHEKSFTENGISYYPLLNPKTGRPENNGLISVTVACNNGALSDALSAACFILGREKGMELLKKYNADGIFIDQGNKVYVSENLKDSFKIVNKQYTPAE